MLICGMTKAPPFTGTLISVNGEIWLFPEHPEPVAVAHGLRRRPMGAHEGMAGAG